jgi:hypothetical protein
LWASDWQLELVRDIDLVIMDDLPVKYALRWHKPTDYAYAHLLSSHTKTPLSHSHQV